jgi:hypothetical protein
MMGMIRCLAAIVAATLTPFALGTLLLPGIANAAECGQGTVYDPASNTCIDAGPAPAPLLPPPPPPPPPPVWNGDLTPGFGVSICFPIPVPFAPSVCAGV